MLRKLFEHLLIWLAASAVIVIGMGWAYALGIAGARTGPRLIGWTVAALTSIFAAALVQRAPVSIVALVVLSVAALPFGGWVAAQGEPVVGVIYIALGALYIATLGPQARRWMNERR